MQNTTSALRHNPSPQDQQSRPVSGDNAAFRDTQQEHFVDATTASNFLSITRKYLLGLSRLRAIPAHPLGLGSRKQWRYCISELTEWALAQNAIRLDSVVCSPRAAKKEANNGR